MSTEALKWAIELAPPMPAQLVATLAGLANHADTKGRGAYPSLAKLAAYACKAERSVRRDLRQLQELGLIRPGDPNRTLHLPSDRRPEVYDLAMELTVPGGRAGADEGTLTSARTLASARARGGKKKPSSDQHREDVDVRGDVDVRPDVGVTTGGRPRHDRGDVGVTTGGTPTSAKPSVEPSVEPTSLSGPARIIRTARLVAEHEERELLDWITTTHQPRGFGWWKVIAANGSLPELCAEWRAQRKNTPAARPELPAWCGHCGVGNPFAEHNARFRLINNTPCPDCHPAPERTAS